MTHRLAWFKSSYSSDAGGNCIEVAHHRRKSSHSGDAGGDCVEVAAHPAAVHVRDSEVTDGPVLTVTPASWNAFLSAAN